MKMNTYRVEVETTNALATATYGPGRGEIGKEPFRNCDQGIVYVITDDPRKIWDEFPLTISVAKIGFGYELM
jgi:hypothetical protein